MICEHDGEPIAATIVTALGNKGIYLLGASGNRGLQLKGSYLLQWQMIKLMKEKEYQKYYLGGINPGSNPGVYHFKSGLSGKDLFHIGQYEVYENIISFFIVRTGELLKNNVQRIKTLFKEQLAN